MPADRNLIAELEKLLSRQPSDYQAAYEWMRRNRPALVAALEAAQRPPLGYTVVDVQSETRPSLIENDRAVAALQLADDRAQAPWGHWILAEVRDVQP